MRANVTLSINMDAYAPELNDGTVDVSHRILTILLDAMPDATTMNVVEHEPEKLVVTLWLDGDFEQIKP